MRFLLLFWLLFSLLFFTLSYGQEAGQEIKQVTSAGGIKAWLIYDESAPSVSISFYFSSAGATSDPTGKGGAMDLLSSMLTQGAGSLDSTAFEKRLNDLSLSMEFSVGRDNFSGRMRSLRKYWTEAAELLHLSLTEARFESQDFDRVKKLHLSSLEQSERNPTTRVGILLWNYVFGADAYAIASAGTVESLRSVSLATVQEQYKRLSKEDLHIGVAGAISPEELSVALDNIFGDLPDEALDLPHAGEVEFLNRGKVALARQNIPQSQIAFMHEGISKSDSDFFTAYLLNHIIGGSIFSSRLGLEVREERGLAYSINSDLHNLERAPIILGWGATSNEKVAETISLIKSIWAEAANGDFTQGELDKARQYLLGSYVIRLTNTQALAGWLAYLQRENYDRDYVEYRKDRFNEITLGDLQRVARKLFTPSSLTFAVVGDPKDLLIDYEE